MPLPHSEAIRDWMFNAALPWWAANGVDRQRGGFIEQTTMDGQDAAVDFKRTRVTARQIYVFSHGHMMGFRPGLDLAKHGMDYLVQKTWTGDDTGFAKTLTRDGAIKDPTPDLYDHAFVLFALSWYHRASSDKAARDWMHRTLDYIERHLRHPREGFLHWLPPTGWRQQNPHMHLTEACLAAFEATGEARFSTLAKEIAGLFCSKFFDLKSGTLGEYFTDDWSRAPGKDGRIVEPGHQMEWAWILNSCRKLLGASVAPQIRAAVSFAEAHGVDPKSSATYNQVEDSGAPLDRGSRSWPNTERIKAAIALYELDGTDPAPVINASAGLLLNRYLAAPVRGSWIDAFDGDGKPTVKTVPASTLYHVFLAFAEVLRVSGA